MCAGEYSVVSPQAKASGKFSREELEKLWREFQHHKEKVREYNVLLETLSRTEGAVPPAPSRWVWAALAPECSGTELRGEPPPC